MKKRKTKAPQGNSADKTWLYGRHAVLPALMNERREIHAIYVQQKEELPGIALQRFKSIIQTADKTFFNQKFGDKPHQGIAAEVGPLAQPVLEDILPTAHLLLMLDQVTDPHNLGACLRSCAAFGCDALILPAHNSAQITDVTAKSASGALESVPVITVPNLNKAIDILKKNGFWIKGLDGEAEKEIQQTDLAGKTALIMGSEGAGLRRLVREKCDELVRIGMTGEVESLNISVAAGIALHEASKQQKVEPNR